MHIQINRVRPNQYGFRFRICPKGNYYYANHILGRPFYSKKEGLELITDWVDDETISSEMGYHLACALLRSPFISDFLVSSQKSDQGQECIEYLILKSYLWKEVFADFLQEMLNKEYEKYQIAQESVFISPFVDEMYPWVYAVYHIKGKKMNYHTLSYTIYGLHLLETMFHEKIITKQEMRKLKITLKKIGLPWFPQETIGFITDPTAMTILARTPSHNLYAQ